MGSITDELRAWSKEHLSRSSILAIADRIDAEHERELRETGEDIVRDVRREWVRLPLDADGVPICVGDVMECGDGTVFTVESISLHPFGWRCDGDGIDRNGYKCTAHPIPDCCHHHATTVEDVLREFGDWYAYTKGGCDEDGIIAEYAQRLRLAGDAE